MRILITGSNGQLGKEFYSLRNFKEFIFFFEDLDKIDISKYSEINLFIIKNNIDCIINCAAYTNVNKAEIEKEKCSIVNVLGVENLVKVCEKNNLKLIHFSTDYVYNGKNKLAIKEDEIVHPINYYGLSKREGEKFIEKSSSESIVIRTSWLYSKFGNNFVNTILKKSKSETRLKIVDNQFGSPTYAKDLALATIKILKKGDKIDKNYKIFNFSNLGYASWYSFTKKIIEISGNNCEIIPINSNEFKGGAERPKYTIMDKTRIISEFNLRINNWEVSLNKYLSSYLSNNN